MTRAERDLNEITETLSSALVDNNVKAAARTIASISTADAATVLERLGTKQRAVAYRLLPKDDALDVFESLDPVVQSEIVGGLRNEEVSRLFAELDPDDRVWLVDELPAKVAGRLLSGLPASERRLTASILGYPKDSIGRRMSPEYVSAHADFTVDEALVKVRRLAGQAETVYTIPVVDSSRKVVGVVELKDLLIADGAAEVSTVMVEPEMVAATDGDEDAARRLSDLGFLAMPVVDSEARLVGIFTIDDAARILEYEESQDRARQGGTEDLRRPYLSTPVFSIARSRVIWLLVLAVGASLTVQVLSAFEATLAQVTVLSLFVPLLIGTGGNTGNQAATTVTRALALGDVHSGDVARVAGREVRVGFLLGLLL
ncbi:MAG: magnesium transporter, partial [Ancrocorticia sp.]